MFYRWICQRFIKSPTLIWFHSIYITLNTLNFIYINANHCFIIFRGNVTVPSAKKHPNVSYSYILDYIVPLNHPHKTKLKTNKAKQQNT